MARAKAEAKPVSKSKAVVAWDEELAKEAEIAANMEQSSGGGQFFSLRGGTLSFDDAPLPGNQMIVVIVDAIMENVYYEGRYDPDTPQSPTCFAFGRDEKDMEPHIIVTDAGQAQSTEGCAKCEHNEFGSADTGRGKACRNTRRLALIPAGINKKGEVELIEDEDHYKNSAIAFMKIPVTSLKGYSAFVKQVANSLRRPPHGIFTKIRVVPDQKTQFRVLFEPVEQIPNELMATIMERHKEAKATIDFPYQLADEQEEKPKPKPKAKTKRRY